MSESATYPVDYRDIEARIMFERKLRSTMLPRFTPPKWWECDVCEITATGYMREYEIKMSRADFKIDADKSREILDGRYRGIGSDPRPIERKHELLAAGDPRGPSRFYFVTPEGLLKPEEIPTWAGHIEVSRRQDVHFPIERILKKAPRLHKIKADPAIAVQIRGACYHRLHIVWSDNYHSFCCKRREAKSA